MTSQRLEPPPVEDDTTDTGPVLFARYAYPPNVLGYCGPADSSSLLPYTSGDAGQPDLGHLAMQFDGAWPYLELIAEENHIRNPLHRGVVEAYWVGNRLLRNVPPRALARSLDQRFRRRAGTRLEFLMQATAAGGVPHHSFHVFAIYPWLGLLRSGMQGAPLEILDRCRIRWGRVEAVVGDRAVVRSQHLVFDGIRLTVGPESVELARGAWIGGTTRVAVGDMVAMHWEWICGRLSPASLRWLQYCTHRNLEAANSLPRPGPATVCAV